MNTERKIINGTAEIQVSDESLGKGISRCWCCGDIITDDADHYMFRAPSRVNAVHMHETCMNNFKGDTEIGSNSKNPNIRVTYSIDVADTEARAYAVFSCRHSTKYCGFMYKVTSPIYTSNNAFTKHFNGLTAYGLDRKCTLECNGRQYVTTIANVIEVAKVAQKVARLEIEKPNNYVVKIDRLLKGF